MDVEQGRRVMRLTLLAPKIVKRLVDSPDAALEKVMRQPLSSNWIEQSRFLSLVIERY